MGVSEGLSRFRPAIITRSKHQARSLLHPIPLDFASRNCLSKWVKLPKKIPSPGHYLYVWRAETLVFFLEELKGQ